MIISAEIVKKRKEVVLATDLEAGEIHLKVEINGKEHFSVFSLVKVPYAVENS